MSNQKSNLFTWLFHTYVQCIVSVPFTLSCPTASGRSLPSSYHVSPLLSCTRGHCCCMFLTALLTSRLEDSIFQDSSHPSSGPYVFRWCSLGLRGSHTAVLVKAGHSAVICRYFNQWWAFFIVPGIRQRNFPSWQMATLVLAPLVSDVKPFGLCSSGSCADRPRHHFTCNAWAISFIRSRAFFSIIIRVYNFWTLPCFFLEN